jgi:hypothetical protein
MEASVPELSLHRRIASYDGLKILVSQMLRSRVHVQSLVLSAIDAETFAAERLPLM